MKEVRALVNGEPARSFADVQPGAELSFDGEVRVGDVVRFGAEYYRASRGPEGTVALEPITPCPECGSPDVLRIVYGAPARGVKGTMLAPRPDDEVALGGCNVWPEAPAWKCRACRHEFGTLAARSPAMFEDQSDG